MPTVWLLTVFCYTEMKLKKFKRLETHLLVLGLQSILHQMVEYSK